MQICSVDNKSKSKVISEIISSPEHKVLKVSYCDHSASVCPSVYLSVRPSFFVRAITLYCMNRFPYNLAEVFGITGRCVAQNLKGQGHTGSLNVKMQPFLSSL